MGGDPMNHNQGLYCQYHQDHRHTTENCRTFHDYLEQLVKMGKLRQFMHQSSVLGRCTKGSLSRDHPWEQLMLFSLHQIGLGDALLGLCP